MRYRVIMFLSPHAAGGLVTSNPYTKHWQNKTIRRMKKLATESYYATRFYLYYLLLEFWDAALT